MLQVGDHAPDFTGITGNGSHLKLSDYLGSRVALYFYPKNNTKGCTLEACSIRDQWTELREAGIIVIGVSGDTTGSHKKFAARYDLPYILFSDRKKEVIDAYGAWRKGGARVYGRTLFGAKRITFLINESGKIVKIFRDPNKKSHGTEILDAFTEMSQSEQ